MRSLKVKAWETAAMVFLFASSCTIPQSEQYEATAVSWRKAFSRGQIKEALTSYEAQAQEAEKSARASLFPQQYWKAASAAYKWAAEAARFSGQLQKSITYGEKALEAAEKTDELPLRLSAIDE